MFKHGGGIINRKPISILLLLFIIAISLNIGVISATITTIQPNINQDILQNPATNTVSAHDKTMNTFSTKSTTFTIADINSAASKIRVYAEANHKLPDYITISGIKVTMPQFLNLLTEAILKINSGSTTAITLKSISKPDTTGVESVNSGKIEKN